MGYTLKDLERFNKKHKINADTGCDEWTAGINSYGYGAFGLNGITQSASRSAWELFVGPIPSDKQVLHKCDNRKCVKIDHLYLGTPAENGWDRVVRGGSKEHGALTSRKRRNISKKVGLW